ncbi:MAG TPA: hypothetical protein VII73_12950 [Caulobacteraceae bacterium]
MAEPSTAASGAGAGAGGDGAGGDGDGASQRFLHAAHFTQRPPGGMWLSSTK